MKEKIMISKQKQKNFHIVSYFLDGDFLKWEEVEDDCPVNGDFCSIGLEDATEICAKVIKTEKISENELKIFLSSKSPFDNKSTDKKSQPPISLNKFCQVLNWSVR